MSKDEQAIEAEIQAKGLTAPRVTPAWAAIFSNEVRLTPQR